MENTATFSCRISTTDASAKLGMEIWLDAVKIFDRESIETAETVEYSFADADDVHQLRFVMKNKTQDHTKIDESGAIISDACLTIADVSFDDIPLGHTFTERAVYTHDFNGNQEPTAAKFYGTMGCNGTVSLEFTSPIYLWLLENMQR